MAVYGCQCVHHKGDEHKVVFGGLAGRHQSVPTVRSEAPVVVLARAVDAGKGRTLPFKLQMHVRGSGRI